METIIKDNQVGELLCKDSHLLRPRLMLVIAPAQLVWILKSGQIGTKGTGLACF